jgi:hypothetical protein
MFILYEGPAISIFLRHVQTNYGGNYDQEALMSMDFCTFLLAIEKMQFFTKIAFFA